MTEERYRFVFTSVERKAKFDLYSLRNQAKKVTKGLRQRNDRIMNDGRMVSSFYVYVIYTSCFYVILTKNGVDSILKPYLTIIQLMRVYNV